jgi:hypothetical protein
MELVFKIHCVEVGGFFCGMKLMGKDWWVFKASRFNLCIWNNGTCVLFRGSDEIC